MASLVATTVNGELTVGSPGKIIFSASSSIYLQSGTNSIALKNSGGTILWNSSTSITNPVDGHLDLYGASTLQAIGFNRDVSSGAIYNSSVFAYQIHSNQSQFQIQRYNGSGTFLGYGLVINTGGNVGMGTDTPYRNAHIYQAADNDQYEGALQVGGNSASVGGYFGYNSTSSGRLTISSLNNSGGANAKIFLGFGLDGDGSPATEVMTLNQGGSVGIGTNAPSADLQVHSGDILITSGKQLISTNSYTQAPPAMLTTQGPSTGATSLGTGTWGIMLGPQHTRSSVANTYYPGIAFNHLLNNGGVVTYNNHPQAWIGTRLHDTPGSERAFLVFSTKAGTGVAASDVPLERMCIDPVNGSVGIGTTDPAAELQIGRPQTTSAFTDSFIKLRPSSTTNSTGLTSITFGTSTVDNYGYSISGWRAGTDGAPYFAIKYHNNSAAGVDVMVMDRYGRVGIGTNAPANTLHVQKDVDDFVTKLENDGNSTSSDGLWLDTRWNTASNTVLKVTSNSGSSDYLYIKGDGKVGIGTNAPSEVLEVKGNIIIRGETNNRLKIANDSNNNWAEIGNDGATGANTLEFFTGSSSTSSLSITNGGYPAFAYASQVRLTLGSTGTPGNNDANWVRSNGANLEFNAASGDFNWEVAGAHKMRLTDTGFLGLGLGAGTDPFGTLHVNGTNGSNIFITRTSGGAGSTLGRITFGNTNIDSNLASIGAIQDGASDSAKLEFTTQPTGGATLARMTINSSGSIAIGRNFLTFSIKYPLQCEW